MLTSLRNNWRVQVEEEGSTFLSSLLKNGIRRVDESARENQHCQEDRHQGKLRECIVTPNGEILNKLGVAMFDRHHISKESDHRQCFDPILTLAKGGEYLG